jgi:FixJ family two-component response regulator
MSTSTNIYVAVVDDDESLCRSLGRVLHIAGMQPIFYASAEGFLTDTKKPQFDCLLLDIQLGGISGIELTQRLVAEGSTTPIIFITAHDDAGMRDQAQALGCAGYFRKSDPAESLLMAIRKALRGIGRDTLKANQQQTQ